MATKIFTQDTIRQTRLERMLKAELAKPLTAKVERNIEQLESGQFPIKELAEGKKLQDFVKQSASGIIFPIIKAEGVRQMFFPRTIPAIYRAPPAHSSPQ